MGGRSGWRSRSRTTSWTWRDAAVLGKPIGSDLKQDKATYPKVLGIPASRALARQAAAAAVAALSGFGNTADPLRALARYVVERES